MNTRTLVSLLAFGCLAVPAAPAQGLRWTMNFEQAIALARKTHKPLMVYIVGRTGDRDDDMEASQKKAFRNPLVAEVARRFVPVKISRSRYRPLLAEWGLPPRTNLEVVFVRPDGKLIDRLSPSGVGNAQTFVEKMVLVFRAYRDGFYQQQIRPKLTAADAKPRDILRAVKWIRDFNILSADRDLVELLDRKDLSENVRKRIYDALAQLSTRPAVQALLKRAKSGDKQAVAALSRCTPEAAEWMLDDLGGPDMQAHLLVYHAVTKICRVPKVKPDKFWQVRIERLKREEIERVRRIVRDVAKKWRARYGELR